MSTSMALLNPKGKPAATPAAMKKPPATKPATTAAADKPTEAKLPGNISTKKAAATPAPTPTPTPEPPTDAVQEGDVEAVEVDIESMDAAEVEALVAEHEIEVPANWKKMNLEAKKAWLFGRSYVRLYGSFVWPRAWMVVGLSSYVRMLPCLMDVS